MAQEPLPVLHTTSDVIVDYDAVHASQKNTTKLGPVDSATR